MKMEQTGCSETSEYKIQTPGNRPKESTQYFSSLLPFRCHFYSVYVPTCPATSVLNHILVRVVTRSTSDAQSIKPLASLLCLLMMSPVSSVRLGETKRDA